MRVSETRIKINEDVTQEKKIFQLILKDFRFINRLCPDLNYCHPLQLHQKKQRRKKETCYEFTSLQLIKNAI